MTTRPAALAGLSLLALLLAGCGSSAAPSTATPAPAASRPAGGRGGGLPGVVGLVAAVNGTEVQVQNRAQGQVAVDLTAKTRITALTVAKKADVVAGDCLTATGTPAATGAGLTATTLTISPASGGSCTGSRRGAGSGPGGGGPSRRPRPSGAPDPSAGPAMSSLVGTVKTVAGETVTVEGVLRTPGERTGTAPASQTLTVTIGASTKIQRQATATKAAIRTGQCLAAFGPSNSIGAVQAGTVSVFPPTGGACTGGFGGGFGGRGMRGGNNGGSGTGGSNGN